MPDVTFGAVSLQLSALSRAGLVAARSESRNRYYRARREALGPVGEVLERMWDDALWRLKLGAGKVDGWFAAWSEENEDLLPHLTATHRFMPGFRLRRARMRRPTARGGCGCLR